MVPEGCVAVAAPRWRRRPLQILIGAATDSWAPNGAYAVSVGSWDTTTTTAATAVTTVTDSTSCNQRNSNCVAIAG